MYRKFIATFAVAFAMLTGFGPTAQAEMIIAGSTTVSGAVLSPYQPQIEKRAGQDLEVQPIGSSRGVVALARGQADMAAISAPLANVVRKINGKTPGTVNGRELVAHEIGTAKVAFVVNPANPVKELSFKQITDIVAGRIKFWSEVGGPNLPIEVVAEAKGGGIRTMVEKTIGEWGDVLTSTTDVQTGTQVVFAVSQLPSALGIATTAHVNKGVFILSSDEEITQPLFLVTKGQPSAEMTRVIEAARAIAMSGNGGA